MGFWLAYAGVGLGGAARRTSATRRRCCSTPPVVLASLLVPALALAGFAWTRRWALRPVLPRSAARRRAGPGRRLPRGHAAARRSAAVHLQLRVHASVPAHHLQGRAAGGARRCLPGAAPPRRGEGWRRRGARAARPASRAAAAAACAVALLALAAWPLTAAPPSRSCSPGSEIPRRVDGRGARPRSRAAAQHPRRRLPGQLFGYYRWGGTVDPILPALADRPVAVRFLVTVRGPRARRPALDGRRAGAAGAARCPASCARCCG